MRLGESDVGPAAQRKMIERAAPRYAPADHQDPYVISHCGFLLEISSKLRGPMRRSRTEVGALNPLVLEKLGARTDEDDLPAFHHITGVGQA